MADKKGLNGAYYGPSIPPPASQRNPPRGRGCCRCLLSLFCTIFIAIVVLAGIAALVFWIVVRPTPMKVHVTDAKLTQFNLTDSTLHYNLALNFTIRNPNRKLGIYQDRIEGRAYYEDARFDSEVLHDLGLLKKKTTNELSMVFKGQQMVLLDAEEIAEFNQQKTAGVFDIDVKFYLRIRWRLGDFITGDFKPKVKCDLNVPLTTINGGTFQRTKCDVDF
ncbi:hypothetical protein FNV43_RR16649 [Rhamnella rubrinervis]|uniref:Late embryogenesis abundant protein LEA-2 subgroup domain-containing protein n=1 Tax=Rhamnella rubrinervis TaxID=2594499 RepID=A0A8K0MDF8_9ROSA|nr:hypothetical protein FNV43_RR16649 [Rhamnella rubrinervis]